MLLTERFLVPVLAALVLALTVASIPTRVAAAPADDIQALYDEAKADLKDGRHVFALKKFKQALAMAQGDPEGSWRMILGAALTYEQMGQIEYTLEYYRIFLDSVEKNRAAVTDKWTGRIKVVEEQVSGLENKLLEERGLIQVNSNPPGARITVDGNVPGADGNATTPFPVYVSPGSHVLRLEKDGYLTADATLVVRVGEREVRNVQLAEKRAEGRLLVATGAPDATVRVDGVAVGTGRDVSLKVVAGPHAVRVERPGFVAFEKSVEVGDGVIVRVEALLKADTSAATADKAGAGTKAKPRLAPLWGYLGGGGGVALIAVGAVFSVLRNKDVDSIAAIDRTNPATLTMAERKTLLDRRTSLANSVNSKGVVAGVFYGLGGAAVLGSAVYLVFFADWGAPGDQPSEPPAPPVSLLPLPGGAGLSFTVGW